MTRDRREDGSSDGSESASAANAAGKRRPPPEGTGEESQYLEACVHSRRWFRVELKDGSTLAGRIDAHDRDLVHLRTAAGTEVVLRKPEIRYLIEAEPEVGAK